MIIEGSPHYSMLINHFDCLPPSCVTQDVKDFLRCPGNSAIEVDIRAMELYVEHEYYKSWWLPLDVSVPHLFSEACATHMKFVSALDVKLLSWCENFVVNGKSISMVALREFMEEDYGDNRTL